MEESQMKKRQLVTTSMDVIFGNVDLLSEILLRLPARSLIRFGLVCKLWFYIITRTQFRLNHCRTLALSNALPYSGVYFYNALTNLQKFDSVSLNDNVTSLPPVPLLDQMAVKTGSPVKVTQSCNGLLMCVITSENDVSNLKLGFVYNPVMNEYHPLPNPYVKYYELVYGYYLIFDPLEPPYYRVYCVKRLGNTFRGFFFGSRDLEISVYVPGTESWRCCCRFYANYTTHFDSGVFWNGGIHWLGETSSVHFDVKSEEVVFETMPRRPQGDFDERIRYFGESCGHLHLIQVQSRYAKKFNVLELDKDTWKWSVKYRVHLARLISRFPEMAKQALYGAQYVFSILSVIRGEKEDDSVLLLTIPGKVVAYNLVHRTTKVIRELTDEHVPTEISLAATGDTFRRHLSPSLLLGSSPIVVSGSSGTRTRPNNKNKNDPCVSSSGFVYLLVAFVALGSIAGIYVRFMMTPNVHASISSIGCKEDDEGSWSIGVFYGDSPFSLKPIEDMNIWRDKSAAWPVANPVITCASASVAGFSSNFVADPFLYIQGDVFYLFFETKNSITMQGDIGVARSTDNGSSWEQLGIALDEDWHLSYPYVFEYNGNIYMLPEGRAKGQLRLYRAVNFPLEWTLEKIIMKKPLVDSFIIPYDGKYWLFGSDHSGIGAEYNAQLEIWYSRSPLGPWRPHKKNPIYNTDKSMGARNGGRPFLFDGNLYRVGQDDGETYGRRVRLFKIEVLTTDKFEEVEVPMGLKESVKGRNAWNGARSHHLDVQRLSSGEWVGVMDGDRVPSGDASRRFHLGCASVLGVAALVILFGVLLGAVKGLVPLSWCPHNVGKRSDASLDWERSSLFYSRMRLFCSHLNRASSSLRARIKPNSCSGSLVLTLIFLVTVVLMCTAVNYIYGGSGAHEAYPLHSQYSQFTLLTMTYDARIWNLKMYVKHYSRCSSVREIVVVWNKGQPPELSEFDSAVPVRIRVEERNSLNNRFKVDPLIKTRAVLELDDDIMMPCDDVERGFKVWREHPERIVGFYPRLANGSPLKYRAEKHARKHNGYNMILTGAAFMDTKMAFEMYWSKEAAAGREVVDNLFNCEDVLLNYLYANASSSNTVEYVKPAWAIDTSKFTGVAISKNTQVHYGLRSSCLQKFSEMYGSITNRNSEFNYRMDGWDV